METANLTLKRVALRPTYTIGRLFINGVFFCDTLEDMVRDFNKDGDLDEKGEGKVYGKTAIPYGTYKVILNISPRMKRMLPRLLNVKGFDGVLIHRGNVPADTLGCILIGENKVIGKVINSTGYELKLVDILKQYKNISITIE